MLKNQTINLKVVEKVALSLEELNDQVIYVGGAVVTLYVTDVLPKTLIFQYKSARTHKWMSCEKN